MDEMRKQWTESNCTQKKNIAVALFNADVFDNDEPILIVIDGKHGEARQFVTMALRIKSTSAARYLATANYGDIPMYRNGVKQDPVLFTYYYEEFARVVRDSVKCD